MEPEVVGLVAMLAVVILLTLRVNVGVALGLPSLLGIALIVGDLEAGALQATSTVFQVFSREGFVVIPLFIAMGTLAYEFGLANDIFGMMARWVAPLRGGLAMATAVACGLFAGITGSSVATIATMARTALPEMLKAGYSPRLAAATVAASGSIGILIPPSTILVLYGLLAEQSIGKMLLAGVVPGILSVAIDVSLIALLVHMRPESAPGRKHYPLRERIEWTMRGWTVILVFGIVVGGIYSGIWLPTEAAAAGVVAVILAGLVRRSVTLSSLWYGLREAVGIAASIGLVIAGAFLLTRLLALTGLTGEILVFLGAVDVPPIVVLLMFIAMFAVLGMFLEGTTILALTIPIALPIMIHLGYDPIWFGVIMVKSVELALYTPPVGLNVYTLVATYPSIPVGTVFRGVIPFAIAEFFTMGVLIAFPWIVTWLPSVAYGSP